MPPSDTTTPSDSPTPEGPPVQEPPSDTGDTPPAIPPDDDIAPPIPARVSGR